MKQGSTAVDLGSAVMPRRRKLPVSSESGEFVIIDPEIGVVHFLYPAAVVVWQCCDGKSTIERCVRRIRKAFLTPPDAPLEHLVLELLAVMSTLHLVVGEIPSSPTVDAVDHSYHPGIMTMCPSGIHEKPPNSANPSSGK
jgi:hypothetical protein